MITLKEARKNAGYTQAELGELIGFTVITNNYGNASCSAYSTLERGVMQMSAQMYLRLCEILHVKPGELEPPCQHAFTKRVGTKQNRGANKCLK